MKGFKVLVIGIVAICGITMSAVAQEEITDVDLRKYALLQEVVTNMKKDISIEINGMIKAQDGMTGKRYKELAATKGDEAKFAAISATDFEKQFLKMTSDLKSERIAAIKIVNTELAKKMVGSRGKTYKAIKGGLSSDEALKSRYDAIVSQLKG